MNRNIQIVIQVGTGTDTRCNKLPRINEQAESVEVKRTESRIGKKEGSSKSLIKASANVVYCKLTNCCLYVSSVSP